MNITERIAQFLSAEGFAVAGASTNRDKYGNKGTALLLATWQACRTR